MRHSNKSNLFFSISIVLILCGSLSACLPERLQKKQLVAIDHSWTSDQINILKQFLLPKEITVSDESNSYLKNKNAAILGKKIFFDKRFSINNEVSCSSCHQPDLYFTDGRKTAKGVKITSRNTPTVIGVAQQQWFFHDGRSDSLWSQALGPLENIKEHGANRTFYAHVIYNNKDLRKLYEKTFSALPNLSNKAKFPSNAGPIDLNGTKNTWLKMTIADKSTITSIFVNIGKSIAAYEQFLFPSNSRVDSYINSLVKNDVSALEKTLNSSEARGMRLFIGKANCTICHFGSSFSDSEFHNVATVGIDNQPYDWGRYSGAKDLLKSEFNCRSDFNDAKNKQCDELKYISLDSHETMAAFKTPSLRNVSKTAPYMHDGQFKDLASVIAHYDEADKLILGKKDLLPVELSKQNQADLVSFLKALDSDLRPLPNWLNR